MDVFSRSAPREILLEFERFFAAWPVQQDKKACASVYARLKSTGRLPSLETLLSSVTHMKSKDRRWIAGFVPNLKFWLLGERWNDSPYQAIPRSTENAMSSAEKTVTADSAQVMQHYKSTSSPSHYSKELEDTVSIAHALWPTITRGRIFASFGLAKCKGLSLAMLSKQLTSYKKSLEAHPASIPFGEWLEACYAN